MDYKLSILGRIWKHLSNRRKKQIFYLNIIIILAGVSELFSVASIIPFLNILTGTNNSNQFPIISFLENQVEFFSIIDPFLITLIVFLVCISSASLLRLITIYCVQYISAGIGSDFSSSAYKLSLNQPYSKHLERNSSEIISSIVTQTDRTVFTIQSILNLSTSLVISIALISSLFLINWIISLSISIIFITLYLILAFFLKIRLSQVSKLRANLTNLQTKSLQEGLGSIRDIILDNSQNYFSDIFKKSDKKLRFIEAKSGFIGGSPKYIFELITLYVITLLAFFFNKFSTIEYNVVPILGSIILGLQRLLPAFQLGYNSWVNIAVNVNSVNNLILLLDQTSQQNRSNKKLPFNKYINLKNVYFSYFKKSKYILKDFNLLIKKGEKIGIVGASGSGKSTIANLLMGLLEPSSGHLIIDGKYIHSKKEIYNKEDWYRNISHVPQDIYLADSSIAENIAFGIPPKSIDQKKLMKVIKAARISDLIDSAAEAFKTKVGERGIQLSGGQRQRIGIARALYKGGDILILDEATSSLDINTEAEIMKTVNNLGKDITILIITHRLNNLENCDRVIKINKI